MRRRAGAARFVETRGLCSRSPADTRTRSATATDKVGCAAAVYPGVAATKPVPIRVAWDAGLKQQKAAARSRDDDLAVDYHCDEKQRQIEQRKFVDLPCWPLPFSAAEYAQYTNQQNSAEHNRRNQVDNSER